MEEIFLILLGIVWAVGTPIIAIVALVRTLRLRDQNERLTADLAQLNQAVAAAKAAFPAWSTTPLAERARLLNKLADAIDAHAKDLAPILTQEQGKPLGDSFFEIMIASANIRAYARRQMPREWSAEAGAGLRLGQLIRPLDTVAAYIPAGRYPLPSTLMMTAIPAQVAGVANICVACPRPVPEVYGTAAVLGITQIFQMGGAQAIAAFAFGTRTVPRADRTHSLRTSSAAAKSSGRSASMTICVRP